MTQPYFDKPEVDLAADALIVVSCGRNERVRLPFWLDYYRSHGVDAFFFVDNASDDGSADYLREQPDVYLFETDGSYVESKSGRLWTTELARHYGMDRWVLTLDADEQLVFPGCEQVTIKELTGHLDEHGFEGLFCFFLDMYGPGSLHEAIYEEGEPFLQACPWFDGEGYKLQRSERFPYLAIFGGPRQRMFFENGGAGNGPSMRKVPLVKWREGMDYIFSTHSLNPIRMADVTGALLHFKFFASFADLAVKEAQRGDRTQMGDYRRYAEIVAQEQALAFHDEASVKYERSADLVRLGYMASSKAYAHFGEGLVARQHGKEAAHTFWEDQAPVPPPVERKPTARLLSQIWPLTADAFAAGNVAETADERPQVSFTYVSGERIAGVLRDPGRARAERSVSLELLAGNTVVARCDAYAQTGRGAEADEFRFGFAVGGKKGGTRRFDMRVAGETRRLLAEPMKVVASDAPVDASTLDGVCEWVRGGVVKGWALDRADAERAVAVELLVDGRPVGRAQADIARADLKRAGIGTGAHGYRFKLPRKTKCGRLDIRFVGTAKHLRRSPYTLDAQLDGTRVGKPQDGLIANALRIARRTVGKKARAI